MRAAVMRDRQLVVDDIAAPQPAAGQVLVRTLACGICGSDLHTLQHGEKMVALGREGSGMLPEEVVPEMMDLSRDVVMGHEFCAEVIELGENTGMCSVGDTVVSMPVAFGPTGIHPLGFSNVLPGGYGEQMVLSDMLCLKVPNGLSPQHAALTEPMAVGLHAVNRSTITERDAAIVLGCGPIGLAVIASLARVGVEPIVAADFSPTRRELATRQGAHVVVDPADEPAIEAWRRADGAKPLHVYEAVGVPGMIDAAMRDAPRDAQLLVVGVCMEPDSINPMRGIGKELTIRFALGYDPAEFSATLDSIAEGRLDVAPLITGSVGLDGVPQAFRDLTDPERHCKILVEPARVTGG
jgi:2-desacetyl-2-hydroxyethyl bacteriochlorophyllide A dehydrogenase